MGSKPFALSVTPAASPPKPQQFPAMTPVTRDPQIQPQKYSMTLPVTSNSLAQPQQHPMMLPVTLDTQVQPQQRTSVKPPTLPVTQALRKKEQQPPKQRRATGSSVMDYVQEIPYPFAAQFREMFPVSPEELQRANFRYRPPSPDPPPPPSTPPLEDMKSGEDELQALKGLLKLHLNSRPIADPKPADATNATNVTSIAKANPTPPSRGPVAIEVEESQVYPLPNVEERFLFPVLKSDSSIDLESVIFDPLYYYSCYSAVREECGYNKLKLFNHWKSKGIDNGLKCSPVLDLAFFITKIPAMYQTRQLSFRVAYDFFLCHIDDRIPSSEEYNPKAYVKHYPPLKRYTAKQLILHYMQVGRFHHLIAE